MNRRIYLASSWRNEFQPDVLQALRMCGHEVYDFRDPSASFRWNDIDPLWRFWISEQYQEGLRHDLAVKGFERDYNTLKWCDTCVLLLPCGSSAHLELGWCCGNGKSGFILIPEMQHLKEPELMYKVVGDHNICFSTEQLIARLQDGC